MLNLFQHLAIFVCYNEFMSKTYAVYILTNYNETTFYIGVTGSLQKRILDHKNKIVEGFLLKNINLIKEMNPEFKDLSESW